VDLLLAFDLVCLSSIDNR